MTPSGTYVFMQPLSRPQQTVLSGLGVAGAVLAAVVVTFAVASGIVAYSLTSADPIAAPATELVLNPLRPGQTATAPLVLRTAAPAPRRRSSDRAAATTAAADRRAAHGSLTTQDGGREVADDPHGHSTGAEPGDQTSSRPPARELAPVNDAVGATGDAVDATTGPLARRLRATVEQLGTRTERTVTETRDVLENAAGNSGRAVGRLLDPPRRRR